MEGLLWLPGFGLIFYLMMRFGCGAHTVHGRHGGHAGDDAAAGGKDPVCGMQVRGDRGYTKVHEGTRYAFCSRDCPEKFEADPGRYAARPQAAAS